MLFIFLEGARSEWAGISLRLAKREARFIHELEALRREAFPQNPRSSFPQGEHQANSNLLVDMDAEVSIRPG
jgi:hypothetical protein